MGPTNGAADLTADDVIATALAHYGVKGMKWGVRKNRQQRQDNAGKARGKTASDRKIKKLDKRFERKAKSLGVFIDVHNAAATTYNAMDVGRINNSPKYKNLDFNKPSKLRDQYHEEHAKAFLKRLEDAAAAQGTNASGTRKLSIETKWLDSDTQTWEIRVDDVKHADANTLVFKPVYNDKGQIVNVELIEDSLSQSDIDEATDEFLEHYGIKGMKWGIRRRRGSDGLVEKSADAQNADAARAKVGKKGNTDSLSNKELQDLVTRMNLERQFSTLTAQNKKPNPALKFVADTLVNVGKQQAQKIAQDQLAQLVAKQLKK